MEEIIERVRAAGVVGAGGAGFPTAVKLQAAPEYIVINGAECEPLLEVDQRLMEAFAPELLAALSALVEASGAREGIFAAKEHYRGAVAALSRELPAHPRLRLKTLGDFYPMGDEQVLVRETLGRITPEGGLPMAVGALVMNVETLLNVGRALAGDGPVLDKYVAVVGAVRRPGVFKIPLGLSLAELLAAAGGATAADPVFIAGGPMMGRPEADLGSPATKTLKGLAVLSRDHPWARAKTRSLPEMLRLARAACCHCMLCTDLCPRHLLGHRLYPDKLMRLASYDSTCEKQASAAQAFLCCECGLCELACVMGLQPWRLNGEIKRRLAAEGLKNPYRETPGEVHPFRAWRQYPISRLIRLTGLSEYSAEPLRVYPVEATSVRLLLKQHAGAPARPCVSPGERVERGRMVAEPEEGSLGAPVHASLSGLATAVDRTSIYISEEG